MSVSMVHMGWVCPKHSVEASERGLSRSFYVSPAAPLAKTLLEAIRVAIKVDQAAKSGEVMPAGKHLLYIFSHVKSLSGTHGDPR